MIGYLTGFTRLVHTDDREDIEITVRLAEPGDAAKLALFDQWVAQNLVTVEVTDVEEDQG